MEGWTRDRTCNVLFWGFRCLGRGQIEISKLLTAKVQRISRANFEPFLWLMADDPVQVSDGKLSYFPLSCYSLDSTEFEGRCWPLIMRLLIDSLIGRLPFNGGSCPGNVYNASIANNDDQILKLHSFEQIWEIEIVPVDIAKELTAFSAEFLARPAQPVDPVTQY